MIRRGGADKEKKDTPAVSVILPTYNEKNNIGPLINAVLAATGKKAEILVVDDDSPDGTWRIAEQSARNLPNLRLNRRIGKKGLVSALNDGITDAHGDIIIWMDCDLSMPPEKIKDLLACIGRGADMAVGSRFMPGGGVEIITGSADTLTAFLMSRLLNAFIRTVLFSSFRDYTSGFIAVKRKVLAGRPLKGDYGEYFIDLVYRALKRGYAVEEIPYICRARREGVSKTGTNIFHYLKKGLKYIGLTLKLRFTKIRKKD